MSPSDIFFNVEFWKNVHLASKWIFIFLDVVLIAGIAWLLIKISNFRQRLEIKEAYKQYVKKPESVSGAEPAQAGETPLEKIVAEQWKEIVLKTESESEEEWRLAIINADALLDLVLKRSGYPGETMMERLKAVKPENLPNLNNLWEAHKIRNQIVHSPDFILSKKEAIRILRIYKQALQELKAL